MNIINSIISLSGPGIIYLFFKAFALLAAFMYLIYAIVVVRQTQLMNKTVETNYSYLFLFIAFLHVFLALILIFLAVFVL